MTTLVRNKKYFSAGDFRQFFYAGRLLLLEKKGALFQRCNLN